ncbi:MAG: hypothetical protein J7L07_07740 [Candidatus Odinarchaeota archaeon]|nr:hypothetical protein [Candidatus Odinarchaeota archaeon]
MHLSNKLFVDINSVRREKFFFEGDDIKLRYKSDIIFLSDYIKVTSQKSSKLSSIYNSRLAVIQPIYIYQNSIVTLDFS